MTAVEPWLQLTAMVRPGPGGKAAKPSEIWSKVVDTSPPPRLPGNWDSSLAGVLDAAERGDWALCAYLAAWCYLDSDCDASALAGVDIQCHDRVWLEVICPIVVDVPRGRERLLVKADCVDKPEWASTDQLGDAVSKDGHVWIRGRGRGVLGRGSAGEFKVEQFKTGGVLQPSKMKQLVLEDEELLELRRFLDPALIPGKNEKPGFLNRQAPCAHIPGLWFHVLAYPLAGDLTKALLRPTVGGWSASQRKTLQTIGATLISKAAKASQWSFVETLLRAGVSCVNLSEEFDDVCSSFDLVRKQWKRDLLHAVGSGRGRAPSLLELAAWQTARKCSPVVGILSALRSQKCEVELGGGPGGRPPLIVAAAQADRWDIVTALFEYAEEEDGAVVFASSLLRSPALTSAPKSILQMVEERAKKEDSQMARAGTLGEYFKRLLAREVISNQVVPNGYVSKDGVLESNEGLRVLDRGLHLGTGKDSSRGVGADHLVFIALSQEELDQAQQVVSDLNACPEGCGFIKTSHGRHCCQECMLTAGSEHDSTCARFQADVLPINLSGRFVQLRAPEVSSSNNCWIAVLCPRDYLDQQQNSDVVLSVPENRIPTPHIVSSVVVRVSVVTPCCKEPLAGVDVYVNDKWAGQTEANGDDALTDGDCKDAKAKFKLAPGKHLLSAPGNSFAQEEIVVPRCSNKPIDVTIVASGELHVFLQENIVDPAREGVMVTTNKSMIPDGANRSVFAALPGTRSTVLRIREGTCCNDEFRRLKVNAIDGRDYTPNEDMQEVNEDGTVWFDQLARGGHRRACLVGVLFSGTPLRIGDLRGQATGLVASNSSGSTRSELVEVRVSRPCSATPVCMRFPPATPTANGNEMKARRRDVRDMYSMESNNGSIRPRSAMRATPGRRRQQRRESPALQPQPRGVRPRSATRNGYCLAKQDNTRLPRSRCKPLFLSEELHSRQALHSAMPCR